MALDLLRIISAAGTGAVTGYLTNNLALKMIFKEYGPFGGVVIKTKDEFIENISALVERDLINHDSLKLEFSRPEFKTSYSKGIEDFINIYLEKRSVNNKLKEIPGWDQNYEILASLAGAGFTNLIEKSSQALKNENLEKIIKKPEINKFLGKIYLQFIEKAESENFIEKLLQELYKQFESQSLDELLTKKIKNELRSFLKEIIDFFEKNYQSLKDVNKAEFKLKLKELFNLQALSRSLLQEIGSIKIADFFKTDKTLEEVKEDSKIQNLIKEVFLNLRIEIDNSNLSLGDLLNQKTELELEQELKKFLSLSEAEILSFINQEEEELNNIILKAVEAEIEASSGLKAMSRQGIYSKYKEKIEEYGRPVEYLKNYIQLKLNEDNQKTAVQIVTKIKDIKLSTIIDNFIVEAELTAVEASIWEFYQENKDKKLFELFSKEAFFQAEFENIIIELLFSLLTKISGDLESIEIIFNSVLQFKLNDLIKTEKAFNLMENNSDKIYKFLVQNSQLSKKAGLYLNNNFFKLLSNKVSSNNEKLKIEIESCLKQLKTSFSKKELRSFYPPFKNEKNISRLTDSTLDFFYNNLPNLLEGKAAEAAAVNLHQLSDTEVQSAIEDFMGKELKPITYLGALLGAAAGIIFSASGAESILFNNQALWLNYLSSALLYGGVGWLTNVLAIWMIFNPYEKKKILGLPLPFTPGVVAKNRNRFANSMGKFVEKELLKADSAAAVIENNREEIKNEIINYFEKHDYQLVFKLLADNKDYLAEILIDKLIEKISNLKLKEVDEFKLILEKALTELLTEEIKEIDFKTLIKNELEKSFEPAGVFNNFDQLEKEFLSSLTIENISSAAAGKYNFKFNFQQLKSLLKNNDIYPFFKYLVPFIFVRALDYNFKEKITAELDQKSDYYLNEGLNLIYQQQEKIAKAINFKKDEIIEAEKEKEKGILKNTLISGALYMANLDEFIDSVVERVFKEMRTNYFPKKEVALKELYTDILDKLKSEDLFMTEELQLDMVLSNFINSEAGGNLITKILYLSEEKITEMIELILNDSEQQLISSQLEISEQSINYFLKKELRLEQKLQLLLQIKNVFSSKNLKDELLKLLKESELGFLNLELEKIISDFKIMEDNLGAKKDLKEMLNKLSLLLEKDKCKKLLLEETAAQIESSTAELEADLNLESLNYLLQLFVESGIDSFKDNSENILQTLNLRELTSAEVEKMNPAEIESVFYNFAGRYFTQLKHYGWFGGIFGLLQLLIRTLI